jgi:hypothetical protein
VEEVDEYAPVRDMIPAGCVPTGYVRVVEVIDQSGGSNILTHSQNIERKTDSVGMLMYAINQLLHR